MMWQGEWRDKIWGELHQPWDIVVIGGGITGAGILREATRLGLRVLLVEQRDFGWGTSSRSSKLVHGGLRYLLQGKVSLTRSCVLARERLLAEGPGLIEPLGFLLATYKGDFPGRWTYKLGISMYDLLSLHWRNRYYDPAELLMLAPRIATEGLRGGFHYVDAQTDDARLVLRLIREAVADGGRALNYAGVEQLLMRRGKVVGVEIRDRVRDRTVTVHGKVVANAAGIWADRMREQVGASRRMRPLRGSHLIFPAWRLPVAQALSLLHPWDRRHVFVLPWEGVSIVGTTDLDHDMPMDEEPRISGAEAEYLMAAVTHRFPSLDLAPEDVLATFAGVRPVIGTGKADPSKESRDHVVWRENGLLTVTGGKLTTFRQTAVKAIKAVLPGLDQVSPPSGNGSCLDLPPSDVRGMDRLEDGIRRRLLGRYGAEAAGLLAAAAAVELQPVPGTCTLWAEVRWGARAEGVVHLDDLLLRRVRLGLLMPRGGYDVLPQVRTICEQELGWDETRWEAEQAAYLDSWRRCYSMPT